MDVNIHAVGSNLLVTRGKKPTSVETTRAQDGVEPAPSSKADLKWSSLLEGLSTTPEIDQKHVDRVAQIIQNGRYSPDSAKVAEKLIGLEHGLP